MNAKEFTVKVIKKEVVRAVLPTQQHILPLSNLDLLLPAVDVVVFFCFNQNNNHTFSSSSMVTILKKSLAQTLAYYYAFAGEMSQNNDGEPQLLCNNCGVDFVEAFADVKLRDLNLYNPHESVDGKLIPERKRGVLAVQVTQFKCGGSVISCTFDHRVADAYSANMFLVSWSEMARSKSLSQRLPSYQRSLLSPRLPGREIYDHSVMNTYMPVPVPVPVPVPTSSVSSSKTTTQSEPNNLDNQSPISRIYYIKAQQIIELQSLANSDNLNGKCKRTKLEAFTAFIWKLIADGSNGSSCRMGIVVDGRARFVNGDNEEQPENWTSYFGNVLSIPFGEMKINELKNKPINLVANAVHEILKPALTKGHFLGLVDWVEHHRPRQMVAKMYAATVSSDEPAVVVSSGRSFPIEKMDFGWGKAVFGSYHFPWGGKAGYVMPMPSPSGNGDWVVYMHLPKDQIEWIETFASHVFKPLTSDFLKMKPC